MRAFAGRLDSCPSSRAGQRQPRQCQQHPRLERLEQRLLFTVSPAGGDDDYSALLSHGGMCSCPVCSGIGLDEIPVAQSSDGELAATNPLSSLPALHSNPGATAKLFLDFNGHFQASWGSWSNATTPVYDQDGDATTFSNGELASIQEVWARVAEDYAPFNIDVTTVAPGSLANQVVAHIAIGGSASDWYGSGAGGVAYIGGFYNSAPNVGYVFENNLGNGHAKYVGEAASHEAGHLFGLQHQSVWSGTTLVQPYNPGNADWAPHMGNGYSSVRTTWHNGTSSVSPSSLQDDLAIISNANNAFGYKADDFGSTVATASALPATGTSVNFSGLIGRYNDQDFWSFTTTGGSLSMQLAGISVGTNLDAVLELRNSSGFLIVTSSPSDSLGASISTTVGAGTFYLVARSLGDYGDMGQYTLTGTLPVASVDPDITLNVSGTALLDGGTLSFGTTMPGTAVTRTVTVINSGSATLTLTPLNANALPTGFTLLSNLGSTSLAAGQSTTFTIRLDAAALGTFSGALQLFSNDGDESPYDLVLSGAVAAADISITQAGVELSDGQTFGFGSTSVGQAVTRTFTVTNTGNSTLTLTPVANLPAGYSLVANLGSTSLAPGQATLFTVRLTAASFGTFSGALQLFSSDSDESPFDLSLTGSVLASEITVRLGGANVTDGQTLDFGSEAVGSPVTRTLTIVNDGNDTLTLTAIDPLSLPAGFSLLANLGSTTLAAGESTSFTLQFDATAAGSFGGSLALVNNDSNENPFDLVLSASASVAAGEIAALVAGQPLSLGGLINFGTTVEGGVLERTITVRNDGTAGLNLTPLDPAALPAGFSLLQNLGSTTLSPGESTTFILRLDAAALGTFSGTVALANTDPDESPFTFQVSGTVAAPAPAYKAITDDGNVGNTLAGSWKVTSGKGYSNDFRSANKGNGSISSSWTFNSLAAGQYQVWATWRISGTNATNAPFTIYDNTASRGTTLVNQKVTPSGLSADGALWKSLGTVTINSGKLVVKLTNAANNKVVADAIRIERVGTAQAPVAEIGVAAGSTELSSGQSVVNFGARDLGSPQTYTFQVTNHGTGSLQLAAIDPASLPAGYSLVESLGAIYLTPGESTSFAVQFDATAVGTFAGTIGLASNDANESPFSFQVSGSVVDPAAPVLRIGEDGTAGHTQAGTWTVVAGKGYANDIRTAAGGAGAVQSTWSFTSLPAGEYQVWATWKISSTYATNAPFSLYHGSQLVGTTAVNQRLTPVGLWDGTTNWQPLGTVVVSGGQLQVRLTNVANGTVVADAIRIEKILAEGSALPAAGQPIASDPPSTDLGGLSQWLVTSFASAGRPADAQRPTFLPTSQPTAADSGLSAWLSRSPLATSPEEELLADALDLLSEVRSALGDNASAHEDAADQLALAALLS